MCIVIYCTIFSFTLSELASVVYKCFFRGYRFSCAAQLWRHLCALQLFKNLLNSTLSTIQIRCKVPLFVLGDLNVSFEKYGTLFINVSPIQHHQFLCFEYCKNVCTDFMWVQEVNWRKKQITKIITKSKDFLLHCSSSAQRKVWITFFHFLNKKKSSAQDKSSRTYFLK